MKVKIVKHTSPNAWYRSDIGMVFDVHDYKYDNSYYEVGYSYNCTLKSDTIPVNEITQTVQCSWQMESKEMKRLEVSLKIQPDGKTVVAECIYIAEELRGEGVLVEKDGYEILSCSSLISHSNTLYVRGNARHLDYIVDYNLFNTPQEAQEYVKIMNELIDEVNNPKTNWGKVEEGAEVTLNYELVYNSLAEIKIKANFHSYIPKLEKVVVIVCNEVKVVDEDKVELV